MKIFRKIFFMVIVCLALSGHFYAATLVGFDPDSSFLMPQTLAGDVDHEVGYIFQNPAGLSGVQTKQVYIQSGSDYLGYVPFSMAMTFPMAKGGMAFSVSTLTAQDAFVVPSTSDPRPQSTGTLTHAFRRVTAGYGSPLVPELLDLGVNASILQQELHRSSATAFSIDAGVLWYRNNLWVGCYTRNLFCTGNQWNTGIRESLPFDMILELGMDVGASNFGADFGFKTIRFFNKTALNSNFYITGDVITLGSLSPTRYSIGAVMQLGEVSLSYSRNAAVNGDFGLQQDLIGVSFVVK
jgi:hypothetical protein